MISGRIACTSVSSCFSVKVVKVLSPPWLSCMARMDAVYNVQSVLTDLVCFDIILKQPVINGAVFKEE